MVSIRCMRTWPALILFSMAAAVTALEGPGDLPPDDEPSVPAGPGEPSDDSDINAGSGYPPVFLSYLQVADDSRGVLVTFNHGAGNGTDPFSMAPFVPTQLQAYDIRYSATGPGSGSIVDWFAAATPFVFVPVPGQPGALETDYWFQFAAADCGGGAKTFHIAGQGADDTGKKTPISAALRVETPPDGGVPSAVAGLTGLPGAGGVQLNFVAPSDDPSGTAKVSAYKIKVGPAGIGWDAATVFSNDFPPQAPGSLETLLVETTLAGPVEIYIAGVDELLQEGDPRSTVVLLSGGVGGSGDGGGSSSAGCGGSGGAGPACWALLLLAAASFRRA